MAESTSRGNGIGLAGATFLVLLVAKLWGVIDWSWLYVTMPLWIVPAIIVGILVLLGLIWLAATVALFIIDLVSSRFNIADMRRQRRARRRLGKAGKAMGELSRSLERRRL